MVSEVRLLAGGTVIESGHVYDAQIGVPDGDPVCDQGRDVTEDDGPGVTRSAARARQEMSLSGAERGPDIAEAVAAVPDTEPLA